MAVGCSSGATARVDRVFSAVDAFHKAGPNLLALDAVRPMADNWLGLHRLELEGLADNEHALALYRRFGFKPEGLRRDVVFRAGIYADTLAMARLRACLIM